MTNMFKIRSLLRIIGNICFPIILISCVSCRNTGEVFVSNDDFSNAVSLRPEGTFALELNGVIGSITCTEHYLVAGLLNAEYNFAVFNLPFDGSFAYCGRKGRGPGEVIDADMKSVRAGNGDEIFFYDRVGKKRLLIDDGKISISGCGDFGASRMPNNGVLECFGGYINVNFNEYHPDKEFVLTTFQSGDEMFFSNYPSWSPDDEDKMPQFVYYKSVMSSADGSHLASFYRNFYKCRFYDGPINDPKTFEVQTNGKKYTGIPVAKDNLVAVLLRDDESSEIQTWSWLGKPLGRFVISQALSLIAMDDKGNVIGYSSVDDSLYFFRK